MYDISAKDRIIIRELEIITADLQKLVEEGKKQLDRRSPAFSYYDLEFNIKKLQLLAQYGKGTTISP